MTVFADLAEQEQLVLAEAPLMAISAVFAVGHPGFLGTLKELRASNKLLRHPGDRGPATNFVVEISAAARSLDVQEDMEHRVGAHLTRDEVRTIALDGVAAAAPVLQALPPEQATGVADWFLDLCRAAAGAAPDRGAQDRVSSAEADVLAEVGQRLGVTV